MRKIIVIIPAFALLVLISCSGGSKNQATDLVKDSLIVNDTTKVSDEDVLTMVSAIPNPVEMSSLLHNNGVAFSSELLNPTDNISKYNTNYKKAINMGIYGTDLVHNISVLIGIGTWIESMYLATSYQDIMKKNLILERVAGQKFVIDLICQMLVRYNKDENIKQLIKNMADLKSEFDKITTTVQYAEPTSIVKNGQKIIEDNSKSTINITPEIYKGISDKVKIIRNKLIE